MHWVRCYDSVFVNHSLVRLSPPLTLVMESVRSRTGIFCTDMRGMMPQFTCLVCI
eukprot:SAG11_NODE_7_length_31267_cov_19.541966_29_plen_55_part_00